MNFNIQDILIDTLNKHTKSFLVATLKKSHSPLLFNNASVPILMRPLPKNTWELYLTLS